MHVPDREQSVFTTENGRLLILLVKETLFEAVKKLNQQCSTFLLLIIVSLFNIGTGLQSKLIRMLARMMKRRRTVQRMRQVT